MTPLPKRRWSTGRQGRHRASQKIKIPTLVTCENCGQKKIAHTVCPHCGFYRGRQIIVKPAKDKRDSKTVRAAGVKQS